MTMSEAFFDKLLVAAANYGFPMIVSWFLLARIESRLEKLSDHIEALARAIGALSRAN